jgi:hypothetical protein
MDVNLGACPRTFARDEYRRIAHRTIDAGCWLLGGSPGFPILLSDLEWLVVKDLEPLEQASTL